MSNDRQRGAVLGRGVRTFVGNAAGGAMGLLSQAGRLAAEGGLAAAAGIRQLADDVAAELGIAAFSGVGTECQRVGREAAGRASSEADVHRPPHRPLRIGLVGSERWPAEFVNAFVEASGEVPVEFVQAGALGVTCGAESEEGSVGRDAPSAAWMRSESLDAAVWCARGEFHVMTRAAEPAFDRWSCDTDAPITYPSVFPLRLDCGGLSTRVGTLSRATDAGLLRALTESAAVLSRRGGGLTPRDAARQAWCLGRLAAALAADPRGRPTRRASSAADDRRRDDGPRAIAARVLSAWACLDDVPADGQLRRAAAEVAARVLPGDVLVALRLVAARFAAGADDDALLAVREVRASFARSQPGARQVTDAMSYVAGELPLIAGTPLAVGRVAAGVCLSVAAAGAAAGGPGRTRRTPAASKLGFIREDILDDLRQSEVFLASNHQREMVERVVALVTTADKAVAKGRPSPSKARARSRAAAPVQRGAIVKRAA